MSTKSLGSNRAVHFSKGTPHPLKFLDRNGPSQGVIQKCELHERSLCARKIKDRTPGETLQEERGARREAW